MQILKKITIQELKETLMDNGFSIENVRVMLSRKRLSKKACLTIMASSKFKDRHLQPSDFCESTK